MNFPLALLLPTLLAVALPNAPTLADPVVGTSDFDSRGNRSPALRHRDCAETHPGSHWCSTREYLDHGLATDLDPRLPTAWIRPALVGGYGNGRNEVIFVDAAGVKGAKSTLHCRQWTSADHDDKGLALQTSKDGLRQKVIQTECSRRLPNLCCGPAPE